MQAWESFLTTLTKELGDEAVKRWLRPLKIVHFDACNLYLEAEDNFQIEWFEEHIRLKAKQKFFNNNGHPIKIHLTTQNQLSSKKKEKKDIKQDTPPSFTLQTDALFPDYTEESFLFNEQNVLLEEILHHYTRSQEKLFNPLFFYGGPSSGKTHLLQAFAKLFQKQGLSALYVRTETFTQNMIQAIRSSHMQNFRQAYRQADVLLIDDIEQLAKKNATQEEFFHTFNTLYAQGKLIILTARVAPQLLDHIEPRLISRFEWGLCLPIHKLEKKDLFILAEKRCKSLEIAIKEPGIRFLVDHFSSAHSLQKAIEALCLRSSSKTGPLNPSTLKNQLQDLLTAEEKEVLTPDRIVSTIARFYKLSSEDLLGKSQNQECSSPRQIAMYLCRIQLKMPYTKIGDFFGRDHSTVMTSVKLVEQKLKEGDKEITTALNSFQKQTINL